MRVKVFDTEPNRKLKILVLYSNTDLNLRKTIIDHLYCFKNYIENVDFHYCKVYTKLPFYVSLVKYDGIILHYTLLSAKWTQIVWKDVFRGLRKLRKMDAVKVAIPQDEYVYSNEICRLFREYRIETVFTCANPCDYQTLYTREKSGLKYYFTTYAGFVDENTLDTLEQLSEDVKERDTDAGYRARSVPFWLGHFGQNKPKLAEKFHEIKDIMGLKFDISTDEKDVFYGDDWLRFILRCRTMLGCLGGASMHDPDGQIRKQVEAYTKEHPEATFEEVEERCFKGQDDSLQLFALSPRHFECAMAKTCQVLLEGDYHGVFQTGIHYIELKKDFSNINHVLQQIKDKQLCERIAEKTYQDIIE